MKTAKRPFNLSIRALDQDRYEICIRMIICEYIDYATWTVKNTEDDVLNELKQIPEGKQIDVRINSRGGDVGLGLGIYNALSRRSKDITTYNDGYALSAASIVMLAGSKRVSPAASVWMIHRCQGGVDGTGDDMRSMADGMDVIDDMMANVYASVSGKKSKEEFRTMLNKTTWFDGETAVELGLATDCVGELPAEEAEITDAERKIIATYEKTIPANLRDRVLPKAAAPRASLPAGTPAAKPNPTKAKSMNKIIAALVAAGFTVATDAQEDAVLPAVTALISERTNFKNQLAGHETALKNRVTAKVDKAIADKVIKAERKDALIKAGMADETMLDFIDDVRAEAATRQPRGVRPAPRAGEEGANSETDLANNTEKLSNGDISAEERGQLASQGLKLRGLSNLFKKQTAEKN